MQTNSQARARAAARLLENSDTLNVAEHIRIAMLTGKCRAASRLLDDQAIDIWLSELNGVYAREARGCLETLGKPVFTTLRVRLSKISEPSKQWLLQWGVHRWPLDTVELLRMALDSGSEQLILTAMECIPKLGEGASLFRSELARFIGHPNGSLRLAAIRSGGTGMDWRAVVVKESEPALRIACIYRLAQEEGSMAIPDLVDLLDDQDWSVRAAVTQALIKIGDAAAEAIQPLVRHSRQTVRVCAVQILLALGKDAWLEQELVS